MHAKIRMKLFLGCSCFSKTNSLNGGMINKPVKMICCHPLRNEGLKLKEKKKEKSLEGKWR